MGIANFSASQAMLTHTCLSAVISYPLHNNAQVAALFAIDDKRGSRSRRIALETASLERPFLCNIVKMDLTLTLH